MIKICFVVTIYITYKSFIKNFAEFLHKQGGYEISLICNDEPNIREDLPEYVHYYPVSMKRGVSLSVFKSMKQIKKILKENEFDIVQYSTPNAAFCASIAAKKARIPVRLYCQWGIRYMGFMGWKRAFFKWLERKTCQKSTFIEAESHSIRKFSIKEKLYKESNSCVAWNGSACGVDLIKFDINKKEKWRQEIREILNVSDNDIVFSFAARLTADKGVNELLCAFKEIENRYKNVKLLIIGGEDNVSSIDGGLLESAKKSGNVIFTGQINNVEKYYAASDIFVAPSYREGFGLVVIEAAAMGLPAIVSDVPGQIDSIDAGKTGLLCEVKNVQSLRKAMDRMIIEKEKRICMGRTAAQYVKENYEQKELFSVLMKNRNQLLEERRLNNAQG